jgi:hypothetical protein
MIRTATIAFLVGAVLGSPAFGADALVEVTSERILVNRGTGFKLARDISEVKPGDLVMATGEIGRGWIIYPDCDVEVLPGRVYTVEDRPGEISEPRRDRQLCKRAPPAWLGASVFGAAAATIVCGAAGCFDDDEPKPTSP